MDGSTQLDDDEDSDSIPSVSTVEDEEVEDEDDTESKMSEVVEVDNSYGGKRGAARDEEARNSLRAWKERPVPREKEDLTEAKWPCYDCRWFFGCCINYSIEDSIVMGDLELVIKAVKRLKRRYPQDWMKRINQRLKDYGDHTVCSLAILEGRHDIAEWLTENGVDIDLRDGKTGLTPLHHAIRQECLTDKFKTTIDLLIEHGCEIDVRDQMGTTPLMLACLFGNVKLVKLLIANGAHMEARDKEGWLPLNYAAYGGRLEATKYVVVEEGASLDIKDKRKKVPEHLASYLHEFEGRRQRHGGVVAFLEAHEPTVF
jgi:hypothetical protein